MRMGMKNNMNGERQKMLATESIGRLLVRLSLPAGIGMFVMSLYNVVDTIFIGQIVGPLGIAGLSIVFPIQMIVMGLGMVVGIGGASLVSRAIGANKIGKAERTLGNSLFIVLLLGVVIPSVGLINLPFWLRIFGASEAILPYSQSYLNVILIGTFFQLFAMGMSQLVRAEGNAKVPMLSMVFGAGLNIALDAIFILVLDMGVRGAAIATILSQMVTSVYILHYFLFRNSTLKIHLKNLTPDKDVIREIITVGMGSFFRTVGGSLVAILINRTLGSFGGDIAIASYGIVNRLMMFLFMPLISIGQGVQPILGFSYGAKQYDRLLKAVRLAIIAATVMSVIAFIIINTLPAVMFNIFTSDKELVAAGTGAARIIFLAAYLLGFQMIGSVVFQALGKAVPTFLTATARQVLFLLPLVFILPKFLGINGIWYAFPIADGLAAILTLGLLLPVLRNLRREANAAVPPPVKLQTEPATD